MDKIMEILGGFDIAKLLPEVNATVGFIVLLARIVTFAVPLLILGLGLTYFLKPTPKANHTFGYRTYFGMGSVSAWKYTQKLAGKVWTGVGIGLAVLAVVGVVLVLILQPSAGTAAALVILIIEFIAALAAYATVEITVLVRYDINGKKRKKKS